MRTLQGARVLITGGLGFIGSNLARRLVGLGADVTLVDSLVPTHGGNLANIRDIQTRLSLHIGDVRDQLAMAHHVKGKDFLFNMVGQTSHLDSMTDPFMDLDINAASQLSILEAARRNNPGIHVVFASTRQIYGKPEYLPVDEGHPIAPVDINGVHKAAGEWYHLLYWRVYGIRCCALRLTNTYGPGMRVRDDRQTFLGIWVKKLILGHTIQVFGDGKQLRDFNYVDDVVQALVKAAAEPRMVGRVLNLGSHEVTNLADLAELMVQIHGCGRWELVPFPPERKAIDIGDYYSEFSQAKAVLGWEPRIPLGIGLQKTLEYYQQHGESYWG